MGLFDLLGATAATIKDANVVSGGRKEIFQIRDRLRGTKQFAELFHQVIGDVNHPPKYIEATQTGEFWSEVWEGSGYEPFSTKKYVNQNVGYMEGCALYLLIQECYPNVYDFPGNTVAQIQNGATIKLIMKKNFVGKVLKPAQMPPKPAIQPSVNNQAGQESGARRFCSYCGNQLAEGVRFCSGCGKQVD